MLLSRRTRDAKDLGGNSMTTNTRQCNCETCIHESDCEHKGRVLEVKLTLEELGMYAMLPDCLNIDVKCKYYDTTIPLF